jgi:DNA-binding transcriptional ArsR family regulator
VSKAFLSRFTPSLMSPEMLEAIFVQREKLAQRTVDQIRDSVLTQTKHYSLLVGPRGIGKTHFVSLMYYRIKKLEELQSRLVIAWLHEDGYAIGSFLDLLLQIFQGIFKENKDKALQEKVQAIYSLSSQEAEAVALRLLKDYLDKRTLLLLIENLDEVFKGLGEEGQQKLRSALQENSFCTILATSPALFNGVALQTFPFYGFFRIQHLEGLSLEEATNLLLKIAEVQGDEELVQFLSTGLGQDRVRVVHELAGGSHRVFVVFSQFLTKKTLDELVNAVLEMLDDLTPYYQARMSYLSPQQRKIIDFLASRGRPIPVKDIAQYCFITHQTASGQLKDLQEKVYVSSEALGRESWYELREPLMRHCLEVKKNRGEPVRLLVDFLRIWYSRDELEKRIQELPENSFLDRTDLQKVVYEWEVFSLDSLAFLNLIAIKTLKVFAELAFKAQLSEMIYWQSVWSELGEKHDEFQIPLRLMNAAIQFLKGNRNKRALMELPIEERRIVQEWFKEKP